MRRRFLGFLPMETTQTDRFSVASAESVVSIAGFSTYKAKFVGPVGSPLAASLGAPLSCDDRAEMKQLLGQIKGNDLDFLAADNMN